MKTAVTSWRLLQPANNLTWALFMYLRLRLADQSRDKVKIQDAPCITGSNSLSTIMIAFDSRKTAWTRVEALPLDPSVSACEISPIPSRQHGYSLNLVEHIRKVFGLNFAHLNHHRFHPALACSGEESASLIMDFQGCVHMADK